MRLSPTLPFFKRKEVIYAESEIEQLSDFCKSHHQIKTPQRVLNSLTLAILQKGESTGSQAQTAPGPP